MGFDEDLTAATAATSRHCDLSKAIAAIEEAEPGWATGTTDEDGIRHPGFWEIFHDQPDVTTAALTRAVSGAIVRLNLDVKSVRADSMRICRRGECATGHGPH